MSQTDLRLAQLGQWFYSKLPAISAAYSWPTEPECPLVPASSDASFRRYFRWQGSSHSLILMDAPPPQEQCQPFVQIAQHLHAAGVHVPQVLAADLARGFLVLSDLGHQTYLEVLTPENAAQLFAPALVALLSMQKSAVPAGFPQYDGALLMRELQLFPDWYLARHSQSRLDTQQQQWWDNTCGVLIEQALQQARVFVHRDFMPRNLMLSTPNPGVLDFQDAVLGPVTYDITCLFKDAFISWPLEQVDTWLEQYWQQAKAAGIAVPNCWADFLRDSDLMGVQRHLKVLGIFARIAYRDGKPKYVQDAPRFWAYIEAVIARRPELQELGALMDSLGLNR